MAVTLNASTSSGFIATSDTSGVLQLQANGVTKATVSSSGFSYPGAVLQVVSATYSTEESTTSTSPVATSLLASITPTSASSKIFAIANLGGTGIDGNSVAIYYIYRGASAVATFHDNFYHNTTIPFYAPVGMSVLDSPTTTSSTTYRIYFASGAGTSVRINANSRSNSIITLMEIAA